jgi:hypothetical protein
MGRNLHITARAVGQLGVTKPQPGADDPGWGSSSNAPVLSGHTDAKRLQHRVLASSRSMRGRNWEKLSPTVAARVPGFLGMRRRDRIAPNPANCDDHKNVGAAFGSPSFVRGWTILPRRAPHPHTWTRHGTVSLTGARRSIFQELESAPVIHVAFYRRSGCSRSCAQYLIDIPRDCTSDHTWSAIWPSIKVWSKANSMMIAIIHHRRIRQL